MKVGICQLTSVLDYKANLSKVESALQKCNEEACEYLFLPECFLSMSDGRSVSPYVVSTNNLILDEVISLAKKYNVYLVGGSAATRENDLIKNRTYNISSDGELFESYDKIHLFSCELSSKKINEGDIYTSGDKLNLVKINEFIIGQCICFDLRFSQMALEYRKMGANILIYPSAFTVPTGKAHWHSLLRARAIESQCFVIAAAQWGSHNENIKTFGHSLIIDPWGEVLVDAKEGEKVLFTDIDLNLVNEVRKKVPMDAYLK